MTSWTWSRDFISKRFLVRTLHIRHVIKVLMLSIIYFYQRQHCTGSSFNSIPFVEVKISWAVYIPSLNHVCVQSHDSKSLKKEAKTSSKIDFLSVILHKWTSSKNNLIPQWLQLDSNPQPLSSLTNTQPFSQTGQMTELCCEYLSVRCIWLYVFIMSRTRFSVNPHSIVAWTSRNPLLEAGAKTEV